MDIPEDGVNGKGFWIVGERPDLGMLSYQENSVPKTFIEWKPEDVPRAAEAMRLDWEETIGPDWAASIREQSTPEFAMKLAAGEVVWSKRDVEKTGARK